MPADSDPLRDLLGAIAAVEPAPWRPGEHARATGADRDSLDEPLNKLRMSGLVRLTEWEPGKGQGYLLTPDGKRALQLPTLIGRPPTPPTAEPRLSGPVPTTFDPVLSRLVIAAQVGVFAWGLTQALQSPAANAVGEFLGSGRARITDLLAVSPLQLRQGHWWTLLSYALVHIGLLHLAMNVWGQLIDAPIVERMWGRVRFLVIYLSAVFGGGAAAVLAAPHVLQSTAGSSGAWCGLIAAEAVWILTRAMSRPERWFWVRHFSRVTLLMVLISMVPGVSWAGHAGGAAAGGASALALWLTRSHRRELQFLGWTLAALLPAAIVGLLHWRQLL